MHQIVLEVLVSFVPKISYQSLKSTKKMLVIWRLSSPEIIWKNVENHQYLSEATGEGKVTVIWLKGFSNTDTHSRETIINSNLQWRRLFNDSVLPWYYLGSSPRGDWSKPKSLNYKLVDYAFKHPKPLNRGVEELLIITAYHSLLEKRLLVDGCKRAVALQTEVDQGRDIPTVRVLECYGTQLHAIFPCDFCNLIVDRLNATRNSSCSPSF